MGFAANIFDKAVISISQLILVPVLAGAWGLSVYGFWLLLSTVPSFLAMGDLGLGTAAGVKMTFAEARGDRAGAVRTFSSALAVIVTSSVVLVGLSALVAMLVPVNWFGAASGMSTPQIRATLLILLLWGVATVQQSILFAGLRCAGLFPMSAGAHGSIVMLETILLVSFALAGAQPPLAAAVLLFSRLVGVSTVALLLRRKVPWLPLSFREARSAEVYSLIAPAGSVMLQPVANALYLQGSAVALGMAVGPAAVPAFVAVRTISRIGLQACLLLNTALMPEFSMATARADRTGTTMMTLITITISMLMAIPLMLALGLFGQNIVLFWSKGVIKPAYSLQLVMALSTACICLWYPLSNLLLAIQRQFGFSLIFAIFSAAGVPLTYVLAARFGATGAGIVMMSIDFLMLITILTVGRHLLASGDELRTALPILLRQLSQIITRRREPGG